MAQNITIAGSSYNDVPAVQFPKQGGGTASFVDPGDLTEIDLLPGQELTVTGNSTEAILYATAIDSSSGTSSTKKIMEDGYWSDAIATDKVKEWDINLTSDVTGDRVIISNDTWLIAHYNNSKLSITLIPNQPVVTSDLHYVTFCHRGNKILAELSATNIIYGTYIQAYSGHSGSSVIYGPVNGSTFVAGSMLLSQTGNLTIRGSTNATLAKFAAGSYHIIATIA